MPVIAGPDSFEALRRCLVTGIQAGTIGQELSGAGEEEHRKIAALALYHEVAPILYAHLQAAGWPDQSAQIRSILMPSVTTRAAHSMFLVGQLSALNGELARAGIAHLVIKGPALAATIYPGPAVRPFLDLDLLMSPDDFAEATRTFERLGFRQRTLSPWKRRLYLAIHGQDSFSRAVPMGSSHGNLTIDVHTNAFPPGYAYRYDFDRLIERSQTFSLSGQSFPGLSPEDSFAQLAFHGVKNRWNRLKFVMDTARSIEASPGLDWAHLRAASDGAGWHRVLLLACLLAADLLDAPAPGEIVAEARSDQRVMRARNRAIGLLREPAGALDGGFLERVHFNMDVQDGFAGRVRYATFAAARRLSDFVLKPAAD